MGVLPCLDYFCLKQVGAFIWLNMQILPQEFLFFFFLPLYSFRLFINKAFTEKSEK